LRVDDAWLTAAQIRESLKGEIFFAYFAGHLRMASLGIVMRTSVPVFSTVIMPPT
jgi:hypothetical protein